MTSLLVIKEYIKNFYSKFEVYITPILKFILALTTLNTINSALGYMKNLKSFSLVLILALLCSFMPWNLIILIAAVFVLLHMYALSLECAAVVLVVFLILFLLYFRFTPKDTLVVLLTPICFFFNIPYVVPITMGLVGTPVSAVSVAVGTVVYYVIKLVTDNVTVMDVQETDNALQKVRGIVDGVIGNKAMLATIAAFVLTVVVVYLVKRLSINYAWSIASVAGGFTCIVVLLISELAMDLNFSILGIIFGTIASLVLVLVLQFFVMNLDYTRIENVQFEDDEYYYYVKAVPKNRVSAPEKQIKKINTPKRMSGSKNSRPVNPKAVKKRPVEKK